MGMGMGVGMGHGYGPWGMGVGMGHGYAARLGERQHGRFDVRHLRRTFLRLGPVQGEAHTRE